MKKGDKVTLVVTADAHDDIHVHGCDIEKHVEPGKPTTFKFTADIEGIFEIESHVAEDAGREPQMGKAARSSPTDPAVFLIAHGISVRTDLPVPEVIFWWAAAIVLVVSFVGARRLWPKPRLQDPGWRPLPGGSAACSASRPVEIVCGAIGVFLLRAHRSTRASRAPRAPRANLDADLHLRDLLAGVRAAGDPVRRRLPRVQPVAGDRPRRWRGSRGRSRARDLPEPLAYPDWLGRWPAAAGSSASPPSSWSTPGANSRRTSRSRRWSTRRSRSSGWRSTGWSGG